MPTDNRAYHAARAVDCRLMASNAPDDRVRNIHLDLARRYEALAAEATVVPKAKVRMGMPATKQFEMRRV